MANAQAARVRPNWRCVLIGSEALVVACGDILRVAGHDIVGVVSKRPATQAWAVAHGAPVLDSTHDLAALPAFDYLFSITNLSILHADVLALPTCAAINFHDGPLPEYAGLNTPAWALLNGEREHGITWHAMTDQVDRGDILRQRRFAIAPAETADSLNRRCFAEALESFGELVDGLAAGSIVPEPQAMPATRTYTLQDRPAAGASICWARPAHAIAAYLRALDFGRHANPLGLPKAFIDDTLLLVAQAETTMHRSTALPGTIVRAGPGELHVATTSDDLRILRLVDPGGQPLAIDDAIARHGLHVGIRFTTPDTVALSAFDAAVSRHEAWWRTQLAKSDPLVLPFSRPHGRGSPTTAVTDLLDVQAEPRLILAAAVACLARLADRDRFTLGFTDAVFATRNVPLAGWVAAWLPLTIEIDRTRGLAPFADALGRDIRELHRRIGHAADLIARTPELHDAPAVLPVAVAIVDTLAGAKASPGSALTIAIHSGGGGCRLLYDDDVLDARAIETITRALRTLASAGLADPHAALGTLPLVDEAEWSHTEARWNQTDGPWRSDACIHQLFVEHVQRTPDAPAVTAADRTLSYAELDGKANRLARHLSELGVGPDILVGIHLERSVDMLIALIAVHKAGGAYLPLDPSYPAARIAHMVQDSAASIILTQASLAADLPRSDALVVCVDTRSTRIAALPSTPFDGGARPQDLAYVIYTSGSTGVPKGVMVEHRNVANFFAGMDAVIQPGGTWLAVTSLSFDISVLELCWTVANGAHVVIAPRGAMIAAPAVTSKPPIDFSLFYFASADGGSAADQYRLLLDGARFADTHGFAAVWTPERHFHAFGGLYPNPSVTSAAIAAITTRVAIRGGSVVVPLHHPARIAEEWSLVDNLSNGRVGIAFASGWQPNDFVLRPEAFADKHAALMSGIDSVRGLWRGETRPFAGPLGVDVDVAVFPRPIQPELPFWITTAGNPDTFAAAGRAGASVLTHLLGQTIVELGEKIAMYRHARAAAGHAGPGQVTLMVHTFVGDDAHAGRETVRAPLTEYLRTSTNLVKEFAWSFPAFKRRSGMAAEHPDLSTLTDSEMASLLDHAFERYYNTGGLFGTPATCLAMVDRLRDVGVDEIGCLIDFGVDAQTVLDHLPALDTLRQSANAPVADDQSLVGLMNRHGVTHLQCTPSMAQMLVAEDAAATPLAALHQMFIGGEAFPPALARRLETLVGGQVVNMYGPTETTIWSTTHVLHDTADVVPLGHPLVNQRCYVLDSRQQPLPAGVPGELVVTGAGVVRGYLGQAELTAARFVPPPFAPSVRAYRTGDLVRRRHDGAFEFLGRLDDQVKIRGHRIELGEIEAALGSHRCVERAIVVAREDTPGDIRLVAYYVLKAGDVPRATTLLDHLRSLLPAIMIPAQLIAMTALPRTPNGKVDRSRLPAPGTLAVAAAPDGVPPTEGLETKIAAIWCDVLKVPTVGRQDNFFDSGGHSLLAVLLHRALRETLVRPLALTDIFRFPTVAALARHLELGEDDSGVRQAQARALGRRSALQRRQTAAPITVEAR